MYVGRMKGMYNNGLSTQGRIKTGGFTYKEKKKEKTNIRNKNIPISKKSKRVYKWSWNCNTKNN